MSDNLASDFARLLSAQPGSPFGTINPPDPDIYSGSYPGGPNIPDSIIAILILPGQEPVSTMGGVKQETYNLQTLIRGVNQASTSAKAMELWRFLNRFRGTVEGRFITAIVARHMPFPLGPDENGRLQWSCNYDVWRRV